MEAQRNGFMEETDNNKPDVSPNDEIENLSSNNEVQARKMSPNVSTPSGSSSIDLPSKRTIEDESDEITSQKLQTTKENPQASTLNDDITQDMRGQLSSILDDINCTFFGTKDVFRTITTDGTESSTDVTNLFANLSNLRDQLAVFSGSGAESLVGATDRLKELEQNIKTRDELLAEKDKTIRKLEKERAEVIRKNNELEHKNQEPLGTDLEIYRSIENQQNQRISSVTNWYLKAQLVILFFANLVSLLMENLSRFLFHRTTSRRYVRIEEYGIPEPYRVTRRDVYVCGFLDSRRMSLWVQIFLANDEAKKLIEKPQKKDGKGSHNFKNDDSCPRALTDKDFKDHNKKVEEGKNKKEKKSELQEQNNKNEEGHEVQRGHQCPLCYHFSKHDRGGTCYMTNICPQHPGLNNGAWNDLELMGREWACKCDPGLWVCSGPMWIGECKGTIGEGVDAVAIPSHYFKVILLVKDGKKEIRAFRFPNEEVKAHKNVDFLKRYMVQVEEIEKDVELKFFEKVDRRNLSKFDDIW